MPLNSFKIAGLESCRETEATGFTAWNPNANNVLPVELFRLRETFALFYWGWENGNFLNVLRFSTVRACGFRKSCRRL
jgi:hypothetical protein